MSKISTLRQRFIDDMNLAGLTESTQTNYIRTVVAFVRRCGNTPPEKMTEPQVESYLRKRFTQVARGTFQAEFGALRFLFCNTLLVEWAIFTKKKSNSLCVSGSPLPNPMKTVSI
jgi:hypothetical protein